MEKVLIIDNYDSFTYNLVHLVQKVAAVNVDVVRNDKITAAECLSYSRIILSPGPGIPSEAGNMLQILQDLHQVKPLLGVCLGHQAIGEFSGAKLKNLSRVFHGVATEMNIIEECPLFKNVPNKFKAGRYHSWVIDRSSINSSLVITCEDETGEIMALRHKTLPIYGVQFHPESILSEYGEQIISNFLNI